MLFLFFASNLLDELNQGNTTAYGFVDDTNILTYSRSTEENCRALEAAYDKCLRWARKHGATFAPDKYNLIHLTRQRRRADMSAAVNIPGFLGKPSTEIRVLRVQVNSKLRWGPHIKLTHEKALRQTSSLTRLVGSTWGASFARAKQIYTIVIRPKITYGCSVWNSLEGVDRASKGNLKKLEKIQNQCLHRIARAYKSTKISVLEHKTGIPPLKTQLDTLTLAYAIRGGTGKPHPAVTRGCERV